MRHTALTNGMLCMPLNLVSCIIYLVHVHSHTHTYTHSLTCVRVWHFDIRQFTLTYVDRGESFRVSYARVGEIRCLLPSSVHVMALTATVIGADPGILNREGCNQEHACTYGHTVYMYIYYYAGLHYTLAEITTL